MKSKDPNHIDIPWGYTKRTQAQVAEMLGITREEVAEIEQRALRKLREAMEEEGLTLEDFLPDPPGSV